MPPPPPPRRSRRWTPTSWPRKCCGHSTRSGAAWGRALLVAHDLGLQLFDNDLLLQIPDLDDGTSGGTEPVAIGREGQRVDLVTTVQGVQGLGLLAAEVPQLGGAVAATGSAKRTVGRDGDGVQVARVTVVVALELAVGQVPHLDQLVPAR